MELLDPVVDAHAQAQPHQRYGTGGRDSQIGGEKGDDDQGVCDCLGAWGDGCFGAKEKSTCATLTV
eukprot:4815711-Pyramimonas_sp.AAC.1